MLTEPQAKDLAARVTAAVNAGQLTPEAAKALVANVINDAAEAATILRAVAAETVDRPTAHQLAPELLDRQRAEVLERSSADRARTLQLADQLLIADHGFTQDDLDSIDPTTRIAQSGIEGKAASWRDGANDLAANAAVAERTNPA